MSAWGGVCLRGVHPPVKRMADRCKNITFLQLRLRTVNMRSISMKMEWDIELGSLLISFRKLRELNVP